MPLEHDNQTLNLDVIAGPAMARVSIDTEGRVVGREDQGGADYTIGIGGRAVTLGRASICEIVLNEATISRRHCSLLHRSGRWIATDLGSRHGTAVNGTILPEGQPTPLGEGDTLALGPWVFRCTIGEPPSSRIATTEEAGSERVEAVPEKELGTLAEQRLGLLLDCVSIIHQSENETALADAALDAALRGTGFTRGALARPVTRDAPSGSAPAQTGAQSIHHVELLGSAGSLDDHGSFPLSRTLLRAAASGKVARLTDAAELREAESVVGMGIKSAICAPVMTGADAPVFLYLDTPHSSDRVERDAAAFCGAIAQVCGMALASIQRRRLEEQQKQLEADLRVARDAQRRMMPQERGEAAGMAYAMRSIPGRVVAGDLFDVIDLGGGKAAILLGDVTGKGMGAALLMAMAQSQLNASLREHSDPRRAVEQVNRYLVAHSADTEFISLWLGVIDPEQRAVFYIDAGHGYGVHAPSGGPPLRIESSRGLLVGIDADFPYDVERLEYAPGDRLILFSDGVVEQTAPLIGRPGQAAPTPPPPGGAPNEFGLGRTLAAIASAGGPEEDVERLLASLTEFTGAAVFNDDVTIASVGLR